MKPKLIITGKSGQVGYEIERLLPATFDVVALDKHQLDFTRRSEIRDVVRHFKPDFVVNAAAYTAVDAAEREPQLAQAINEAAPKVLAEECTRLGAWLIHYSTDYVFDGAKGAPYIEIDDPRPLNVYGNTKLAGERAIQLVGEKYLILRISWVFSIRRDNFLIKIIRLAQQHQELRIVNDQIGIPTWSRSVAAATCTLISHLLSTNDLRLAGLYHLTGRGSTSWYDFALQSLRLLRTPQVCKQLSEYRQLAVERVIPIRTSEFPTAALRPSYSAMDSTKVGNIFGIWLPHWTCQLGDCLLDEAHVLN